MKNLLLIILGLTFSMAIAQRHEIGVFTGGANIIGDIGRSNYINPMPVSYDSNKISDKLPITLGVLYRFNFNPHMGVRFNLMFGKAIGTDSAAPESYKRERGYSYKNNITEGSLVFEYNFFDINDEHGRKHSPYIFGGVGAFMYNKNLYSVEHAFRRDPLTGVITGTEFQPTTQISARKEKETKFTTPFGAGYKLRIKSNFILSAEVGFRYTKTDNLDYSFSSADDFTFNAEPGLDEPTINTLDSNIIKSRQIGNTSNNDWYVFTGFTLTYSFGRPPCYCD